MVRLITMKEMMHKTGDSRRTIYNKVERGDLPKPVKTGASSIRWLEHEVDEILLNLPREKCKTNLPKEQVAGAINCA